MNRMIVFSNLLLKRKIMNKKVWHTIQYILILLLIIGLLYVGISIEGNNWDPMLWKKELREGAGVFIFFAFLGAAWIQSMLND